MYTIELILIYLTILEMPVLKSQNLESPCPNVFQYRRDQQIGIYGEISIIVNPTNSVQLDVQMSVGNQVTNNGKLELARPKDAFNSLTNRQPLRYYLYFPNWSGIPPKITQIRVNQNIVCSGPAIPVYSVRIITMVSLRHTFRTNVQYVPSPNAPPGNNFINFDDTFSSRDQPPPRSDGINDIFDVIYRSPGTSIELDDFGDPIRKTRPINRFNFQPTIPPNQSNFNLHPSGGEATTGRDGIEMYNGNPFFKNLNIPKTIRPDRVTRKPYVNTPPTIPDYSIDFQSYFDQEPKGTTAQPSSSVDDVCGQPITANQLIFNGQNVLRGAFPWLVAIFLTETAGVKYICTGSLISSEHVVTAAHCVEHQKHQPDKLLLILGKNNIQKWTRVEGAKMVEAISIDIHPDYKSVASDADIAVIVIAEALEFTPYIRPVCLWKGDTNLERVVGKSGTVVGWGMDENGILTTDEPKQISLPVVSQEKCLASNPKFHYFTSQRTFCAGSRDGKGPCSGDSGSGFILKYNGRWVLRGIVSTAISESTTYTCDLSNYIIFCDASKFSSWLLSFLK